MPKIKVNTNGLQSFSARFQNILGNISSIKSDFDNTASRLDWDVKIESNINNRLNNISRDLQSEMNGIAGMASFLQRSKEKYDTVNNKNKDSGIKDPGSSTVSTFGPISGIQTKASMTGKNSSSNYKINIFDAFLKYKDKWSDEGNFWTNAGKEFVSDIPFAIMPIKALDVMFKASSIYQHINDKNEKLGLKIASITKDTLGIAKNVVGIAKSSKKVIDAAKDLYNTGAFKTADTIKELGSTVLKKGFGVFDNADDAYKVLDNSAAQSFANMVRTGGTEVSKWQLLKSTFTDQLGEGVKNSFKGLGAVTTALTVGITIADNVAEYQRGEISGGRAIAESVTESVIEIGKGVVIGAAVAAVGATVGAPVVAVAAGAALVSAGLDWASKKITGKGFTEALSDAIIDTVSNTSLVLKGSDAGPYTSQFDYA